MRKRLTGLFIILLILTAFSSVAVAQDTTTLLWGMWGSPEEIAVHQQVADAYMKENPNVKIELWSQPWGD
jgi:ABC-type glycerol-3-phosphate transport system substrate-binding protein